MPDEFDFFNAVQSDLSYLFPNMDAKQQPVASNKQRFMQKSLQQKLAYFPQWEVPDITLNTNASIPTDASIKNLDLPTNPEIISHGNMLLEADKKPSLKDKFQNGFLGQNAEAINQGLDTVGNIAGAFDKKAYEGPKGGLRQGIDQGWNAVSDAAANFGPYGQMASMAMKAAGALNSIQNAALGDKALDNMTTQDAILSSPLGMMIPGLGLINALTGKNADTITKNEEAFAQVGSSYGGANSAVDDALNYSGKRYGGFSSGARKDANALIAESRRQQNAVERIGDESAIRRDLLGSMSSIS